MSPPFQSRCTHPSLLTTPSPHAQEIGYQLRNPQQLFTASTGSRKRVNPTYGEHLALYPAPLVLPDDELAHDPDYPAQSFVAWKNEKERNVVGGGQEVVYVANYPNLDRTVNKLMTNWDVPIINHDDNHGVASQLAPDPPAFGDILAYLQAFFHGLPVKGLDDTLAFTTWEDSDHKSTKRGTASKSKPRSKPSATLTSSLTQPPQSIGLSSTSTTITTRIRVRHLPATSTSPYLHQLNLNDILDHAIAILPSDAYSLLLLVNHDLYEDEDDDFCVGRAYGGSRIAVVSGARYQPVLDDSRGIDASGIHGWPASHCKAFVQDICEDLTGQKKKKKQKRAAVGKKPTTSTSLNGPTNMVLSTHQSDSNANSRDNTLPLQPLSRAITAHADSLSHSDPESYLSRRSLFTRRLSLTTSHELLHCFGLDHCVYLACAMQGTASIAEDTRQPPYLCPVCENKLAAAIVLKLGQGEKMEEAWWEGVEVGEWKEDRRKALLEFCEGRGSGFAGLGGWYKGLIGSDVERTK